MPEFGPPSPLAGKRIVVTRSPKLAGEFVAELQSRGANVVLLPMVDHAEPEDWRPFDNALRQLDQFDTIIFLSRNAVGFTCKRALMLGMRGKELLSHGARFIAVVGAATAREAARLGIPVNHVASGQTAESLVDDLHDFLRGRRVFLPRSSRGDDRLREAMCEAGAEVTEVIAYRTTMPEIPDQKSLASIREGSVDVITFASPSAFQNLCEYIGAAELARLPITVSFAAIGQVTAEAIRKSGVRVDIEAATPSTPGFVEAIVNHYGERSSGVNRAGARI